MDDAFDINKTTAEFIKLQLATLCETAKNIVEGTAAQIRLRLKSTYKNYLTAILTKYSKTKSFLLYREEVPLYKFYQRLDLTMSGTNRMIKAVGIQDVLGVNGNVIISGSAGSGKSMLVRHLLLDAVVTKCLVPIFVELRQFNTFSGDLIDLIVKNLEDNKFLLGKDYVVKAIAAGHFVLFLDGYDEIAYDWRSSIREHIQNFVTRYDKNKVILTSRPDPEFEGWPSFSLLNVCPLTKDQACSLIKKLPFENEIKDRFLIDLGKDLFRKHVSFLSNPLLLTIMLLSYGQSASIPNKINIFYEQAFEALFQRHDVLKGGFKRHFLTQLDRQDFSRLFSAFCLLSYDKHMLTFSQTKALELIQKSQQVALIDCNKDHYLKDLIESVCLLVHDGLEIAFSHRSFQEYFTALFIFNADHKLKQELITRYARSIGRDNVISMLHEIDEECVVRYYILPKLNEIFKTLNLRGSIGLAHYQRFLRVLCCSILIDKNGSITFTSQSNRVDVSSMYMVEFILRKYRYLIPELERNRLLSNIGQNTLAKKWIKDGVNSVEISLTAKDKEARSLLRDFSSLPIDLSLDGLKGLVIIHSELVKRYKSKEQDINQLLSLKQNGSLERDTTSMRGIYMP